LRALRGLLLGGCGSGCLGLLLRGGGLCLRLSGFRLPAGGLRGGLFALNLGNSGRKRRCARVLQQTEQQNG
jgi:hypothetical protein